MSVATDRRERSEEARPLSGAEIRAMIPHEARVLPYSDIAKYATLTQLLGPVGCIILYRSTGNVGHWVAMIKGPKPGEVSYFDSIGMNIDEPLKDVPTSARGGLGQEHPLLSELIKKALLRKEITRVEVNHKQLQRISPKIADCGRYAALRLLNNNLSNAEFANSLTGGSGGNDPDITVTRLTLT